MADVHVNIEQQIRIREQVLDQITNIAPTERPFLAALGRMDATNTKVEWTRDTLAPAVTTNKQAHGFSVTFAAADWAARSQTHNFCQLMEKQASVDLSHEAVEKVGIGRGLMGELKYQKEIKLDEGMNDLEATLLSSNTKTQPLPNTGTAGQMDGAQTIIASNVIATGAGNYPERTLEQAYYDDLSQLCWQKGGKPTKVFCGAQANRAFSGWVTQVNRPVSDSGKKLTNLITQYQTFGTMVDVIPSRNLATALLLIEPGRWKTAWLREPKWYWVSGPETVQGDFFGGYYAWETTLVSMAEDSGGKITNFNYTV